MMPNCTFIVITREKRIYPGHKPGFPNKRRGLRKEENKEKKNFRITDGRR